MNLASQSVLEGLNACFDFRHQLFVPELGRTFDIGTGAMHTRFFACQNPSVHGGNRRTLPKSFVNRFTSVSKRYAVQNHTFFKFFTCRSGQCRN